ncbi:cation:proton antiporter [Salinicoccus hispanicus]|uniref:Sodium:proton antiporter n=1 Tax=Salinicoccus hispanicus TaxID=157225 RepID=A0A6N8U1S6_9STAP|nr:sodium:proton antiporter [Salinicoccus hispanicus]MXQ51673.1 sodium:proton antiporter [Salinicoccus hispanicus]
MDIELPLMLLIVVFISLGILSQWLAAIIKWPPIVVMSIVGLLIGPVFQLVNPEQMMGSELFSTIVSLAVAIILFEGSSNLDYRELPGVSKAVTRIITVGAVLAWLLGTLAMYFIFGFPLSISFVMAGLFIVTGPTVIQPLLKQAKVKNSVNSILRWESIILDPVGPLFALFAFYMFQIINEGFGIGYLMDYIIGFAVAFLLGYGASYLFRWLIKKDFIPQNLMAPVQFIFILLIFSISHTVLHESGLLAVTIFGLVMARLKNHSLIYKESDHFIEEMTLILLSTVFILITSSLTREVLGEVLNWQLALFCVIMILVIRPIYILLSTINTEISLKERTFISFVAPRGIVALAVAEFFAGLFISEEVRMADFIVPVTFGFVFVTVVIYGFSFKPLSKWMKLSSTSPPGVILLGENMFSLALAKKLDGHGIPVLISDLLNSETKKAQEYGLETFEGNLLSKEERVRTDLTKYDQCLLTTRSYTFNHLAFNELSQEFGLRNVGMLTPPVDSEKVRNNIEQVIRHHILFDDRFTYYWFSRFIDDHEITELDTAEAESITEDDIILYHIDENKNVTFKTITDDLNYTPNGVIGILKDAHQFKENRQNGTED